MQFDSETTYIHSHFGILRLTKLFIEKDVWWTLEAMPVKATTAQLYPFQDLVGTEVQHKRFGCTGRLGFNCTTDPYAELPFCEAWKKKQDSEKRSGPKAKNEMPWFHKDRKLCQFAHVRWPLVEGKKGKEIISAWTNLNDLEFFHPIQFS